VKNCTNPQIFYQLIFSLTPCESVNILAREEAGFLRPRGIDCYDKIIDKIRIVNAVKDFGALLRPFCNPSRCLQKIEAIDCRLTAGEFLRNIKRLAVTSQAQRAVRNFLTKKSEIVLSPPCLKVVKYLKSSRLVDQS
jgi:hypothetical protein